MLVLASNSPRRKQLLNLSGWEFSSFPVEVNEDVLPEEAPREYVLRLAQKKATVAMYGAMPGSLIVAADTTVVDQEEIIGKPCDRSEALRMLEQLRGRVHQVYTALALIQVGENLLATDLCITNVHMRFYSDNDLNAYVDSGDPLDKAGAYAIQHAGFNPVKHLEGCYANVVGLPICHLNRLLAKFDVFPWEHAQGACTDTENYNCLIKPLLVREG